ncbi:hypothetical protein [Micromonospora sp. NPDC047730]|uniref:hypothetical protein n=1 Tax=Micromonospora sp. NPDC047730 TaxID=3364253 RepID=UPI00371632C4
MDEKFHSRHLGHDIYRKHGTGYFTVWLSGKGNRVADTLDGAHEWVREHLTEEMRKAIDAARGRGLATMAREEIESHARHSLFFVRVADDLAAGRVAVNEFYVYATRDGDRLEATLGAYSRGADEAIELAQREGVYADEVWVLAGHAGAWCEVEPRQGIA